MALLIEEALAPGREEQEGPMVEHLMRLLRQRPLQGLLQHAGEGQWAKVAQAEVAAKAAEPAEAAQAAGWLLPATSGGAVYFRSDRASNGMARAQLSA